MLAATFVTAARVEGQAISSISQTRKLYVEQFSEGEEAAQLRDSLIKRLGKSGRFQVVEKQGESDAVVKASGEIWVKGHLTINSRAPAKNRAAVYGGFLSVEMVAKDGEPLWSYLVTPSKFSWTNIRDDLANNLVKEMLLAAAANNAVTPGAAPTQNLAKADLAGAGATFPAPLYRKWFTSFGRLHPGVHITYAEVGTEQGIQALAGSKVDFAASDLPSHDTEKSLSGTSFVRVASVLGAVVPAYNVKGVDHDLRFTPDALAGIFIGRIKKWNDPEIKSLNKDVDLPDADIVVIHRSDGSGTTYAWSEFLSITNTAWKNALGTGMSLKWPVGKGADGNEGVATTVQQTSNSIGYVELVYGIQHHLIFGDVRNRSGEYVRADLDSLAEAARAASGGDVSDAPPSILNSPGKNAYPIATFTWLLFSTEFADAAKKQAMIALLNWVLTTGQKECASLGFAPLPREVVARQLEIVKRLK
jgi:phosphate ABC transporter phosphate-binding protein